MKITMKNIIEHALVDAGLSKAELARRIGMSPQNLQKRLTVGRFSYEELSNMAEAMGAQLLFEFVFDKDFEDGNQ